MPHLDCSPDPALLAAVDALCFAEPWDSAAYVALLRNPAVQAWLLREDSGAAVGLLCFQAAADEGEVYRIALVPEARRRGLGLWLLKRLLARAPAAGWRRVLLEVREGNAPARALYARAGFTEAGRRRGYYQAPLEDAVVCVWEATAAMR